MTWCQRRRSHLIYTARLEGVSRCPCLQGVLCWSLHLRHSPLNFTLRKDRVAQWWAHHQRGVGEVETEGGLGGWNGILGCGQGRRSPKSLGRDRQGWGCPQALDRPFTPFPQGSLALESTCSTFSLGSESLGHFHWYWLTNGKKKNHHPY